MEVIKRDWKKTVMRLKVSLGVIVFLTVSSLSFGKDFLWMYEVIDLKKYKEQISPNISWNLEHVIMPVLTMEEREMLQDVQLEYSLISKNDEPFMYFAKRKDKKIIIVIPIFSIKFLDDLAIATAWLQINGYTLETIPEYLAMLKYRKAKEFQTGRYPPPLKALHIPNNALESREVYDLATNLIKSTVIYLLCQELGYIYSRWPRYPSNVDRMGLGGITPSSFFVKGWENHKKNILESDTFALELMRRMGLPPFSLAFYFSAQTYWTPNLSDFKKESSYIKSMTLAFGRALFPERLFHVANWMARAKVDLYRLQNDRLASAMQIKEGAREIFRLGEILEAESKQKDIRKVALTQKVDDLRPRRKGSD